MVCDTQVNALGQTFLSYGKGTEQITRSTLVPGSHVLHVSTLQSNR
jgi:hypothetical protein